MSSPGYGVVQGCPLALEFQKYTSRLLGALNTLVRARREVLPSHSAFIHASILDRRPLARYKTLGVAEDAEEKAVKSAFRRLSVTHHPDKGGDPKLFNNIREAYEVAAAAGGAPIVLSGLFGSGLLFQLHTPSFE